MIYSICIILLQRSYRKDIIMNFFWLRDKGEQIYDELKRGMIRRYNRKECKKRLNGALTKEQIQQIQTFFKPYQNVTTMFHQMYYEKTEIFSEKHLPTDVYINVVDEYFNNSRESKYLDNKCYYRTMLAGVRQPDFALARIGGFWYDSEMQVIKTEQIEQIANSADALFAKIATGSCGGKGVQFLSKDKGSMYSQLKQFASGVNTDIIVQYPVKQHSALNAVNESSVNTIRLISLLTENGPKIYSTVLRAGVQGKKVDNYSSGGVTIGIDCEGKLKKYAYNAKGERFERHPTSGLVFEGHLIPGIEKARELVTKAHPMLPHFRLVSFDVAINDAAEPVLIEVNLAKGDIEMHQFNNGPLFGEDTEKVLNEVYGVQ